MLLIGLVYPWWPEACSNEGWWKVGGEVGPLFVQGKNGTLHSLVSADAIKVVAVKYYTWTESRSVVLYSL